ncbi:MAG: cupin domain-containing protein, partial [Woeseia sp.]|nr:cupin domain-containing protein [Woeseia sp.]
MSIDNLQLINWDDIPLETVNSSMRRRIVTGELMTVARIYFEDGFVVPMHSHHNEQVTQVLKGTMRFVFG